MSSANLLRMHSIPSSRSLTKILNRTGHRTEPWGTPFVPSCQLDLTPFTTMAQPSQTAFHPVKSMAIQATSSQQEMTKRSPKNS